MVNEEDPSSSNKRSGAAAVSVDVKQVRIDEETHKILTGLGQFGETYGDIVKRIAKHYATCPEVKKEHHK
jgi:hypothetical protein